MVAICETESDHYNLRQITNSFYRYGTKIEKWHRSLMVPNICTKWDRGLD